ncbi:MAG: hypothetical protein WC716_16435, partial [Chitinophagaceae bacterium]
EDVNKTLGRGYIIDAKEQGQLYVYGAHIPPATVGGIENIPGYLPGADNGGSGVGIPSDDFDDNSINTGRWTATTGQGTITESGGKLNISKTGQTVEDVFLRQDCTVNQSIGARVDSAITAHTGSAHDVTKYLKVYYDANNYVEIGYRDVNGTLSIRSKICIAGVLTMDDIASPPTSTEFIIRLMHNRAETYYKTALGAWVGVGVDDNTAWVATGWKIQLGVRCDSATSNPNFIGTFDNLRVQCESGTGFEDITPEDTSTTNTNVLLVCEMQNWKPGIWDDTINSYYEPPWHMETLRAQCMVILTDGTILAFDNTTGKCYKVDNDAVFDDQEFIPYVAETQNVDYYISGGRKIKNPSGNKKLAWAYINGDWGLPFYAILTAYPRIDSDKNVVNGYGSGNALGTVPMGSQLAGNTEDISVKVKWQRLSDKAFKIRLAKMDNDTKFALESIETEIGVGGSRK